MTTLPKSEAPAVGRRRAFWTAAKMFLAVALVGVVLAQIDGAALISLWQGISLPWAIASTGAFFAIIVVSARRSWLLIDPQVSFRAMFGLVALQTVVGNFVASSAGLASYVALLRGRHQVRISQAVVSVLILRLADLLALLGAMALASAFLWDQISPLRGVVVALLVALGAAALSLVCVFLMRERAVRAIGFVLRLTRLNRFALCRSALDQVRQAAQEPTTLLRRAPTIVGYSCLNMLLQFAFTYSYTRMIDLPLGGWEVLFVLVLGLLISLIPIQVFGGLGVSDLTTLYLYQLFGVAASVAAAAAVSARLFLIMLNLLLLLCLPFAAGPPGADGPGLRLPDPHPRRANLRHTDDRGA